MEAKKIIAILVVFLFLFAIVAVEVDAKKTVKVKKVIVKPVKTPKVNLITGGVIGPNAVIDGKMRISTVTSQKWLANGATEFRVDVYADSTGVPDKKIRSAEWHITVPANLLSYITFINSSLPASNDFFDGFTMYSNRIDNSIVDGELNDSSRLVLVSDGPSNRTGVLGSYWFTLSSDAPEGNYSFGLHSVSLYDAGNPRVTYKLSSGNLQITNQPFTVVHSLPADFNQDGMVDQGDYTIWYNHYGINGTATSGDANGDGRVDQADYTLWFNSYGTNVLA